MGWHGGPGQHCGQAEAQLYPGVCWELGVPAAKSPQVHLVWLLSRLFPELELQAGLGWKRP